VRAELKQLQVRKKDMEMESESKLEEVRKYEKQQYEIKSNTEYQALQKEIDNRKIDNARIEDRIIEVMEKVEEAERIIKSREEFLKTERDRLATEEKKVAEQSGILDTKINDLKGSGISSSLISARRCCGNISGSLPTSGIARSSL